MFNVNDIWSAFSRNCPDIAKRFTKDETKELKRLIREYGNMRYTAGQGETLATTPEDAARELRNKVLEEVIANAGRKWTSTKDLLISTSEIRAMKEGER